MMLVALVGKDVIRISVTVPSGSLLTVVLVNVLAGTFTLVVPPGLMALVVPAPATGNRSTPKLTLVTPVVVVLTLSLLFGVASSPAPVPTCSPVLTQPEGKVAEESGLPAVWSVVVSMTLYVVLGSTPFAELKL